MEFKGTYTALVTPFRGGRVDLETLDALLDRQVAGGVTGVVPCGTTGETPALGLDEVQSVIERTVKRAAGRVHVIAGTGTNSTRETIERTLLAEKLGCDAAMVVMPYYNKPTQAGLVAHVRAVHDATRVPIMLYNVPGRTASDLSVEALAEIAASCERVQALKEATGNVVRTQHVIARLGSRIAVLSGDDALTLGIVACGGRGVVSVTSNLTPDRVAGVVNEALAGRWESAREKHLALVALHDAMFVESNPGPVKAAMATLGLLAPEVRLPLSWPTEKSVEAVRAAMRAAGLM